MTRLGVLTGGGDVPGLNPCIKTLVYAAADRGYEVIGLRRGWAGLLDYNLDDDKPQDHCIRPLTKRDVRTIDRTGGTFLHTSRTNPGKVKPKDVPGFLAGQGQFESEGPFDFTSHSLAVIDRLGLDWLVAIGGDDTLSYAERLSREGVKVLAVPKTMDNDVQNTEYCIGFSTALTRAVEAINRQRTTIGSHERVGIFRIFGRDAGFTSLYTAYVTSIRCCIPEVKFDIDRLCELLVQDRNKNPSHYSLVLMSEGAAWKGYTVQEYGEPDAYGHRKKLNVGEAFSDEVKKRTGLETTVSDLTYELRSGDPDFLDKMIGTTFATMAFECVASNAHGRMMAIRNGIYTDTEIPDPKLGPRSVDVQTMYNIERFRPSYQSKKGLPIFMTRV